MTDSLTPSYVDADYLTIKNRIIELLSANDTFKDYSFEGSNIGILLEMFSYISELNTFYVNRLANNINIETADTYEVVHPLVRRQGYEPSGYIAASCDVVINIQDQYTDEGVVTVVYEEGDTIFIPEYYRIDTGLVDADGSAVYYSTVENTIYNVTSDDVTNQSITLTLKLKQGAVVNNPIEIDKAEIVDNRAYIGDRQWDHDRTDLATIKLLVGDEEELWELTNNPFTDNTLVTNLEKAFFFGFDKYKRYYIQFYNSKLVPDGKDLKIIGIETLGVDGLIGKDIITEINDTTTLFGNQVSFISNVTKGLHITTGMYSINGNTAATGASDIETIEDLRVNGFRAIITQDRNITKEDYNLYLASLTNVADASVWGQGEQYVGQTLPIKDYNRVYLSLIPSVWTVGTVSDTLSASDITFDDAGTIVTAGSVDFSSILSGQTVRITGSGSNDGFYTLGIDGDVTTLTVIEPLVDEASGASVTIDVYPIGGVSVGDVVHFITDNLTYANDGSSMNGAIVPYQYNQSFIDALSIDLESRRALSTDESFVLPEIVYFKVEFGLKVKRSYNVVDVINAIKCKMVYLYRTDALDFAHEIDFREIQEAILDVSIVSDDDSFTAIRGIDKLTVRSVDVTGSLYTQVGGDIRDQPIGSFPFEVDIYSGVGGYNDNELLPIKLGYNQFPSLDLTGCVFNIETY